MVGISQGDVWWAELEAPEGSAPGYRRPVLVIQGDAFSRSKLATVICIPLASNLRWTDAPGNVLIPSRASGLGKDSVANVSQIVAIDREQLTTIVGRLSRALLDRVLSGLDLLLGR